MAERFRDQPTELPLLQALHDGLALAADLPFEVNLWKVQNIFYEQLHTIYPQWRQQASQGQVEAQTWIDHFIALGEKLMIHVD